MTMRFNGTELEEVSFNGVDCEKVYFNGVLVFEKSGAFTVTLTNHGSGEADGPVTPNHPVLGNIWFVFMRGEAPTDLFMAMSSSNTSHTGSVRVTFGGMTITLSKSTWIGDWLVTLTSAQWNALPKTGTHPLIIEAIP